MAKDRIGNYARTLRHRRVRRKVSGTADRPRLCVFRSLKHIYAQVVDDERGVTLAAATSAESEIKQENGGKSKTAVSAGVGALVASRAKDSGVTAVVFDRGGYKYHGRVQALADAAREGGLVF